ncbi:putative transferase [Helianthus debilis subsp. tardiflorus]
MKLLRFLPYLVSLDLYPNSFTGPIPVTFGKLSKLRFLPEKGVKLLGGAVSRDPSFIGELAGRRASGAVDLMKLLPCLRDPQCELLLLRSCMSVAKLLFGLRTCQPHLMEDAISRFDDGLRKAIEDIVVGGGPFFGDLQWRLASLPMRLGGLGLFSARDVGAYAFVASRAQSWELQDHIIRNGGVVGLDPDYQQALECLNVSLPDLDIGGFSNVGALVSVLCLYSVCM